MSCFRAFQADFLLLYQYIYSMSNRSVILITLQFLCFLFFLIQGNIFASGILLACQILGFILCLWSILVMRIGHFNVQPEVKKNAVFVNSGPYRLIRNPMYAGLLIFFGAGVLHSFQMLNFMVFLLLFLVFLLKIRSEEKFLEKQFGENYVAYKKKTKRLVPYLF
jgi:protein-S-isoprenylcysteine O-methyltransferase Ste14